MTRKIRRLRTTALALAVAATVASCGGDSAADDGNCAWPETSIAIGGGATGGVYYLLAATLEQQMERNLGCVSVSTASGTISEFIRQDKDLVLALPDAAYAAWAGDSERGYFQPGEQFPDYRAIAVGYANPFLMITQADSPARTVSDLRESDVVGSTSGQTNNVLNRLFELHGVRPQVRVIQSFDQEMTALRQGQLTAVSYGTAHPSPALVEAQQSQDLRVLPYDSDALEGLTETFPDYEITTVRGDTYDFMDEDVEAWARRTMLIGLADIDPDLVREITRMFYEDTDVFAAAVPAASEFTFETMQTALDADTIRIPFHPGARTYFEENGITFPESVPVAGQ